LLCATTPPQFEDAPARNAFEYLQMVYIARTRVTYIYATESMGLCLLVFMQLSLKAAPSESKTSGTKTEFGVK